MTIVSERPVPYLNESLTMEIVGDFNDLQN